MDPQEAPRRYEDLGLIEKSLLPEQTRSEIERYKAMMEDGLITPEEFEKMRVGILRSTGLLD
jgi:hypothetical protein